MRSKMSPTLAAAAGAASPAWLGGGASAPVSDPPAMSDILRPSRLATGVALHAPVREQRAGGVEPDLVDDQHVGRARHARELDELDVQLPAVLIAALHRGDDSGFHPRDVGQLTPRALGQAL